MDTSALLVVFLLVTAATLASYALSHWSSIRGTVSGFGLAATSIGTTLLLTAAAIVILTFVFLGPLWRLDLGSEQQLRDTVAASKEILPNPFSTSTLPSGAPPSSQAPRATGERQRSAAAREASLSGKEQSQHPSSTQAAKPNKTGRSAVPASIFADDDPWAATRCVHVYNPGSDTTHWKIENGCDAPVGVILSFCSRSAQECGHPNSTVWEYPHRPMMFPAKLQRPITLDEQTVHGQGVRYVACFFATSAATYLIGAPSEERSTAAWREQLDSIRVSDGCLSRVQSWSDEGRRTRLPVDVLLGVSTQLTQRDGAMPR